MAVQYTQVQQWFEQYKQTVAKSLRDTSKPWTKVLNIVEERTGVDRVNIFFAKGPSCNNGHNPVTIEMVIMAVESWESKVIELFKENVLLRFGASALCAVYLMFGGLAQLLCNVIGVMYPAYISIHAIESSTKQDDTKWLTYWVTFGIFTVIEFYSGILTHIIPFYWLLKCVFLIWCMLPTEQNGSTIIYHKLVRPYFLKHHQSVDKLIDDGMKKATNVLKHD